MSNRFHDMELRVFNASPCEVRLSGSPRPRGHRGLWQGPWRIRNGQAQGSSVYDILYILEDEVIPEQRYATKGDLTIPVTCDQAFYLIAMAKDNSIYHQR